MAKKDYFFLNKFSTFRNTSHLLPKVYTLQFYLKRGARKKWQSKTRNIIHIFEEKIDLHTGLVELGSKLIFWFLLNYVRPFTELTFDEKVEKSNLTEMKDARPNYRHQTYGVKQRLQRIQHFWNCSVVPWTWRWFSPWEQILQESIMVGIMVTGVDSVAGWQLQMQLWIWKSGNSYWISCWDR